MASMAKVATCPVCDRADALPEQPIFSPAIRSAELPILADHVLVEITRSGAVQVSGVSSADGVPAYLTPPVFSSLPQAILAAHQWADAHGVGHVFLRDDTAS